MKKIISLLLVTVMLFAVMAPMASAADERTPIIYIRGNGNGIYYPDGTFVTTELKGMSFGEEDGIDKDVIVETAVNILKPFVLEGMLFDNWDNYGRAIYDEISPLFEGAALDGDGNPMYGTGVHPDQLKESEEQLKHKWYYDVNQDYTFCYDWRLSPYDNIERLHEYVMAVKTIAQTEQVSLYARCMGGSLLKAYLDEYGDLGHVKNVMFCDVLSNETTVISKGFSGQIEFDAKLIEKFAGQLDYCGRTGYGMGFVFSDLLNEIVFKTMDFFNQINVTDNALDGVEALYEKLYKALVPAICHASGMATQVNYWSYVAEEDMDKALELLYGKEGSELRMKYAGLIEKIQKYRENISSDLDAFYDRLEEKGIHYGFIGKYGYMNPPLTVGAELLSDSLVSLTHATMGATTAPVGKTLSESYIAARIAEDAENAKYISPDKQVDLSTCLSPETTWVVKNAHHDVFDAPRPILLAFLNGTNETAETISYSQFQVYDDATKTMTAMTEDNCAEFDFITRTVDEPTTETRLVSFMRFFSMLLKFLTQLFNGTLDFSNILG